MDRTRQEKLYDGAAMEAKQTGADLQVVMSCHNPYPDM
jgi:hypothetical protein